MKKYIFIVSVFFSNLLYAQNKLMFDTLKVDYDTKLKGFPASLAQNDWFFIFEKPKEIRQAMKQLMAGVGKEVSYSAGRERFLLTLIQGWDGIHGKNR